VVKVTQVENGEFLRNLAQLIQPHTADIEDEFTDFLLSPQAVKQNGVFQQPLKAPAPSEKRDTGGEQTRAREGDFVGERGGEYGLVRVRRDPSRSKDALRMTA
jgi:hypothetical protein